ncbi:peptidase, U32 family [Geotalea daltonii FRC-32]|uniref:Peptidase, U32 family n=1 Tax=Geotalea daltonii (strain DSM 22248 / JCM 15807 / FRC-32) TaxID=316067 RepID=B9M7U1_GEODF|nr:U32 family peptidase [Geotalea daltonii]ACM18399.1 peptidase, U32 family [Geotalea daltonii FRC-32]
MSFVEKTRKKPELLSPAGSLEAFFAAMEKGADAVYAGLQDFSARAKAKNFSLSQMERMLAYAHSMGRRVYVTINTLVKESELPRLVEVLASLEEMRVDGVILQDMATARLIRNFFPGIPLHASTQMTIHNSLGVKQLEKFGFQRVVLARELHLDEIRAIADSTTAEIECFIHGALCFSFSGQCYFSSFLGGHSGNRGRCAQPCRRQYTYRGKEGYYFSTNDFSSIDLLPQLVDAGVSSLKIEGRMKSAEYVASVVGAYRQVLDAPERKRAEAVAAAKELLKLSFGRVPTKGFLASHQPTDIATPSLKGATGRFLGAIKSIQGNRITFETKDKLHVGDRIRVQPKSDMAGRAFTIKELYLGKQQVKQAHEKALVSTPSPFPFKIGDTVFKVSSETAFTMSESACLKKLDAVKGDKLPCKLQLAMVDHNLRIEAMVAGKNECLEFPLGQLEEARTTDMEAVLTAQFNKTGDTAFTLASLAAPGFPAVLIPPVKLKEIRREFYRRLAEKVAGELKAHTRGHRKAALQALAGRKAAKEASREELTVRLEHIRDYHLLHQNGIDSLIMPVSRANMHQVPLFVRKLKAREQQVIWQLPFIIFEADIPFFREAVTTLTSLGFRRFEATNLSHFELLSGHAVEISTDYRLFSLNSQALLAWQELGASAATLYIEDDAENMAELLAADVPIKRRVIAYCGVPAITSKIRIKDVRNDVPVVSDRNDGYVVTNRDGLTVVTPNVMFSLTAFKGKLKEMGCSSFILDLSQISSADYGRIINAFDRGVELNGTSDFNFNRGLV